MNEIKFLVKPQKSKFENNDAEPLKAVILSVFFREWLLNMPGKG